MAEIIKYKVLISDASEHFVQIEAKVSNPDKGNILLQLPAWRPGRYELANYAKNIRKFKVLN